MSDQITTVDLPQSVEEVSELSVEQSVDDPVVSNREELDLTISYNGNEYVPSENELGIFERLIVHAHQLIEVTQSFPDIVAGTSIRILAMDGGQFSNGTNALIIPLDDNKKIAWSFQAAGYDGLYRVMCETPDERKIFEFWVGPESAVVDRHSPPS